jgi:quercetin dioxygenase-like cupin family protein
MKEPHMPADTRFDVLLRSEQTDGALAVTENTVPAGWPGPPLHHHDFDETFYVLDGELVFQLGQELHRARAGTLMFAARGTHHTLANHGAQAARYLLVITPPGFERYFDRLAAELTGTTPPPESHKPFPETITVGPQIDPERPR